MQFPGLDPKLAAVGAYVIFVTLNILGVTIAASFELIVTILAILELLVFMGVVTAGLFVDAFHCTRLGRGRQAEPGRHRRRIPPPSRSPSGFSWPSRASQWRRRRPGRRGVIPIAYIAGILTLLALAFGVMIFAGGVGDWRRLANINDPLPQAMKLVVGSNSGWLHMLVWLGLFGLIASFHGIIMGYSRQMFALGRAHYLPAVLARLHPRFGTPYVAILAGAAIGVIAIYSDSLLTLQGQGLTATIVTLSVFGALTAYVISMASLFRLRRSEPALHRPYLAPLYPFAPGLALVLALVSLGAMIWLNIQVFVVFLVLMGGGYGLFRIFADRRPLSPFAPEA